MASLEAAPFLSKVTAINISPSGFGKTGALGSLANAGYKVRIWDFDAGTSILADPGVVKPECRKYVHIHQLLDNYGTGPKGPQGIMDTKLVGNPRAFANAMTLFNHWKTKSEDLGPITSWGTDCVAVIDSLTFMCKAAMQQALFNADRLNQRPRLPDWGVAQDMVEGVLSLLQSNAVKCHVIVNAHVTYVDKPGEEKTFIGDPEKMGSVETTPQIAYPLALGKALPPKIESFFNLGTTMTGSVNKKIQVTGEHDGVRTKNPMPSKLKHSFPIETGWADIFHALTGVKDPSAQGEGQTS